MKIRASAKGEDEDWWMFVRCKDYETLKGALRFMTREGCACGGWKECPVCDALRIIDRKEP